MNVVLGCDAVAYLRELADGIESGHLKAEQCVIVHGEAGGVLFVRSLCEATGLEVLGTLRMGEQIMLNTLMPDGNLN